MPSEGANDLDVRVDILGDNLEPQVHTDFGHAELSRWDRAFTATLVPIDTSLPEVALRDVAYQAEGSLSGTVGTGAARGFYGLRVVDSFGREGFVPEVYRVVASPTRVATFQFEPLGPQRPGVPFTVRVSALDEGGQVVDGFASGVDLTDTTGTATPGRIEAFVLGRARAQVSVDALTPADTLTAVDLLGHRGSSATFAVQPGLVV